MELTLNAPLNPVSFGQVSYGLLHEMYRRGYEVFLHPIGKIDLSAFKPDPDFHKWIADSYQKAITKHDRERPALAVWHLFEQDAQNNITGYYRSYAKNTTLLSFHELSSATELEINVASQYDVVFTSQYTINIFKSKGVNARYCPLFFDSLHFAGPNNKKYYNDHRIAFLLPGKQEIRKRSSQALSAWAEEFGNSSKYYLNLAIYNPFFPNDLNNSLVNAALKGKHYWNINNLSWIPSNSGYADLINANHVVIGASGAESWCLPSFHGTAMGKHAVIHNCTGYKGWANDSNAVLFNPHNLISSIDGVFFKQGAPINQGEIFNWNKDEFIAACHGAIKRYESNPLNTEGLRLQTDFSVQNTLDTLLKLK